MSGRKVAVVTGANRGLGLAIVKELCKQFDGDVFLTARDGSKGQAAVQELKKEGLNPKFVQMDVGDHKSILKVKDFLQGSYGGLDVLVNNAGILHDKVHDPSNPGGMDEEKPSSMTYGEMAEDTIRINYLSALDVCNVLFPLLRPHARVVHMSSMYANICIKRCSPEVKAKFVNPDITMDELTSLMREFVQAARENRVKESGFDSHMYGISKIGLTVMAAIQQRDLDKQGKEDVVVNACTPGFVKTDMTQNKGYLSLEEGIITPLYLALLPPNVTSPRGLMLRKKQPVDWANE